MAKIAKRRDRYVIDYYDNRGKRRWQTLKNGTTLKQAKDELRNIENQLEKGIHIPAKDALFFEKVASNWLKYKKANVRGSTWHMYRGHVENHFENINDLKINRITIATVEKFISDRRKKGVSLPTLRKILITFGQVMKYAVRHRYIDHYPVTDAERPQNQSGDPLDRGYVLKNYFWPTLEAAGLPRIRFHDLRHSYASLLIDQGENIKYIQKQLGHSKPTVTLDI